MSSLLESKRKYRRLYCTCINGVEVIFRLPSFKDYKAFTNLLGKKIIPDGEIYDLIFEEIVQDPELIDKMQNYPAGLVHGVVTVALHLAGTPLITTQDTETFNLEIALTRKEVENNIHDQLFSIICMAFPSYTPTQLEELDWREIMRLLLMAEGILIKDGRISPEEPLSLKAKEKPKDLATQILEDTKRMKAVDHVPSARPGQPHEQLVDPRKSKQMQMIHNLKTRRAQSKNNNS